MDIKNRVAIITGGASGIGRATAELFWAEGAAHVGVADLNEAGAKEVAAAIDGTGVGLDVSDEAAVVAMIRDVESEHGRVDVVFSNAGYATRGGLETGNGYSELNDPREQRSRMEAMAGARAKELSEQRVDEDYILALEHGMPPAAGFGVGIDRMMMLLTDSPSIRDVILFPLLKPKETD